MPYVDIRSISISFIEVSNREICIIAENGQHIKLLSNSAGRLVNGKVKNQPENHSTEFDVWISELHSILIANKYTGNIEFSEGNISKTFVLIALALACLIGIFFRFQLAKFSSAFFYWLAYVCQ